MRIKEDKKNTNVNNKVLPLLTISLRAIIKPSFIGVTPLAVRPAR